MGKLTIQSSHSNYSNKAHEVDAEFLHKHSKTLLIDLRKFMLGNFGFGDFVFRNIDGKEISRSKDVNSLCENLQVINEESILFHTKYNHFSNWLANRGEFQVASQIRPVSVEDFNDTEKLRDYLIDKISSTLYYKKKKNIINFSVDRLKHNIPFLRIGGGSLGGKARGLLFLQNVIAESGITEKYKNVKIGIPKSVVIGTDEFDNFIKNNDLLEKAIKLNNDDEITKLFLTKSLSNKLKNTLFNFLEQVKFPIAVRSSSLLEDSQFQPLAGLYSTLMLPNSSNNINERLDQLCEAIIRIFSSTYSNDPKSLVQKSSYSIEEEKMAILVMEMIGQKFENRYYPTISGVTRNINYYPISYMNREEGIANIALGFGKSVVEGEKSLRFSPMHPNILPQYFSVKETIKSSQNSFYTLKLDHSNDLLKNGEKQNLIKTDLETAENDGQLFWAASVVSFDDNIIREGLSNKGIRVITFSNILKYNQFPLSEILLDILNIGRSALGNPVEIEFAINLNRKSNVAEFYLLQIRPMLHTRISKYSNDLVINTHNIICKSAVSLGNGQIDNVRNIVFIDSSTFDTSKTAKIAREVEYFNNKLGSSNPYILIGPGRWGTADPWLGIPTDWNQISNAAVIVEVGLSNLPIDPSFGTHFFQNITGLRIGYFTINPKNREDIINEKLIGEFTYSEKKTYTSWIKLDKALNVSMNGITGEGIVSYQQEELMDEEQSSGI